MRPRTTYLAKTTLEGMDQWSNKASLTDFEWFGLNDEVSNGQVLKHLEEELT